MIPRRLRKFAAVVAGALVAGVPVATVHHGIDAYVERQAANETRLAAQRSITRVEWRIGQVVAALAAIGTNRLNSCDDIDAETVHRAVMSTTPIKQIAAVDAAEIAQCLPPPSPARVLSREVRTADERVFLSVIRPAESAERALRVRWHRAGDALQLAAHIPADMLLPDGPSSRTSGGPVVRVMLNEGTLIAAPFGRRENAAAGGDAISVHTASTRYPLTVTATVARAAMLAEHSDLRAIGNLGSAGFALIVIALSLIMAWRERANPIIEMERALKAGQFVPYYQPVVDLRSGAIVGAEVLMRWRKGDGSVVPPATFIPLAESSGLILDMTRALMIAARDEMAPSLGLRPRFKIGFNLTARHFGDERIVAEVREIFGGSPIRLGQVVLEVTERQPLEDLEMARRVIAALQELGCKVAIDDVGTGHGGLSYMLKLGVNFIKIDKLFVDAIGTELYSTTIIETLISLARSMRMELFAEGVETFDQVKYLRARGIFLAQGYAFAPPLPGTLFRQLLDAANPLGAANAAGSTTSPAVDEFMAARDRVAAA